MKNKEVLRSEIVKAHRQRVENGEEFYPKIERRIKRGENPVHDSELLFFCHEYGIETRTDKEIRQDKFWDKIRENDAYITAISALGEMRDREIAKMFKNGLDKSRKGNKNEDI